MSHRLRIAPNDKGRLTVTIDGHEVAALHDGFKIEAVPLPGQFVATLSIEVDDLDIDLSDVEVESA